MGVDLRITSNNYHSESWLTFQIDPPNTSSDDRGTKTRKYLDGCNFLAELSSLKA